MKTRPAFTVILVFCVLFLIYNFRFPQDATEQEPEKKIILKFTPIFGEVKNNDLDDCPLKNKCEVVVEKSLLGGASAVVFHDLSSVYPNKAFENQKMVMYTMESAPHVVPQWSNVPADYIDWVMSHLSLSDVSSPYGGYWVNPETAKTRGFPPENLPIDEESILSNKTVKGALWFVSNCKTPSGREKVFAELGKHFRIDVAGACAKKSELKEFCPKGSTCEKQKSNYYFLVIAENSVCRDYITEKYWDSYRLPMIPIVFKRKIYESKIPPKSFIAVDDFQDAQSMAVFLNNLMENKTAFLEFFEWRKEGWAKAPWNSEGYRIGMCDLCDKLWKKEKVNKPPYKNVLEWYTEMNGCEDDGFAKEWIMMARRREPIPYMEFDKFSLRAYAASEIKSLGVVHIHNPQTFDTLGYPLPNGLYDGRMGPIDFHDRCEYCRMYGKFCPGHFGYIHLDVPAFNPVLFPFLYNLLKGSCIHCHRFMCNTRSPRTKLLLTQLRCMELGLVSRAEALYNQIRDHIDTAETKEDNMNMLHQMAVNADKFDETICELTGKTIEQLKSEYTSPTKNAMDLRNTLMRDYLKDQLFKHKVVCSLCKGRNGNLRNDDGRSILVDFGSAGLGKSKMPSRLATKLDDGPIEEYMDEVADVSGIDNGNGVISSNDKNALRQQLEDVATLKCDKLTWRGAEVREHFRLLWRNENEILKKLFPLFDKNDKKECPMDVLFYELLLVPPTKYRPMRFFQGERFEDSQTIALRKILESNEAVVCTRLAMDPKRNDEFVEKFRTEYKDKLRGNDLNEKLHFAYIDLQMKVNALYDNEPSKVDPGAPSGIRQLLEKKQGLFRMNMMGKRVNYACRSVITPDPYLDVDEIGIPEIFAKKLTFPTTVSGLNINKMREYIERGPKEYPGANYVSSNGTDQDKRILSENEKERRQYSRLLDPGTKTDGSVTVFRHLLQNEMVLMNRQPSLHKPSIMGHRVRILRGQRALRMNYAPCKAYNADFDGDEMNGHFIQNMVGQVEARELVNVGSSYLVPKDGTPILGLIQDHVVSGVLLTLRDTFLTKADFTHLVLTAFSKYTKRIKIPLPAIFYPQKLWTGKQVITCIVQNCVPDGAQLINLHGKAKTPVSCWKVDDMPAPKLDMSESEVIFSRGALVSGVLDKAHYGATQYGLIHCCYELYGHKVATKVMSCFSRCFTTYLQFHGFSLGVADILVKKEANKERRKIIRQLRKEGENVVRKAFNLSDDVTPLMIKHACAKAYNNNSAMKNDVKMLDFTMKQTVGKHNTNITNACVPNGLIRSFPQNSLQLMIQSGAKGSSVNAIQISCALGQIELEGQRPGLSATGRTLPSFKSFDPSPRAGGFVDQRFLTGIDPQELYFHTMAGREGLIDTAVKTSRSGYLQRCIIKHLEGITTNYDGTVRDHDGSIIQFKYGEDGLDVGRATFLNSKQYTFLERNLQALRESSIPNEANEEQFNMEAAEKAFRKIRRKMKKQPNEKRIFKSGFSEFSANYPGIDKNEIIQKWFELEEEERQQWNDESGSAIPDPVDVQYNVYRTLGALPEKMLFELDKYVKKITSKNEEFKKSIFWKGLRALVEPGENVGLLAAQSIGEPSTQMTLNTFHFAGRGEMNVTLGIPRLREILMTSGARIATPSAEIRIFDSATDEDIERLKAKFNRVYLKQCIRNIRIEERIDVTPIGSDRVFVIGIEISKTKDRESSARHISRSKVIKVLEAAFVRQVCSQVNKMTRDMQNFDAIVHRKLKMANEGVDEGDIQQKKKRDDESSDEEIEAGPEIDAAEMRLRNRHLDDAAEYEGEDVEEAEVATKEPMSIESAFMQLGEQEESDKEEDDEEMGNGDEVTYNETTEARRNASFRVINSAAQCEDYSFDTKHNRWCIFTIKLLLDRNKVNVNVIVEDVVNTFVVQQTEKVEKCVIRTEQKDDKEIRILQTQGINLEAFYECADILDVNSIYSNDLNLMLERYGVEACNRSIVKEMNNVFGVYGIDVNPRHLTLVADYMTFTGRIAPFSRTAMASSPSPLQKMTFETTMTFMRDTLIGGYDDHLHSPSSRIVTGQLIKGGTGSFDLFFNPYVVFKERMEIPQAEAMDTRKVVFSESDDD